MTLIDVILDLNCVLTQGAVGVWVGVPVVCCLGLVDCLPFEDIFEYIDIFHLGCS